MRKASLEIPRSSLDHNKQLRVLELSGCWVQSCFDTCDEYSWWAAF